MKRTGFTLIELLIVIGIIGILAAVLVPNLLSARRLALSRAENTYAHNVYKALNAHVAEFPNLGDLSGDCVGGYDVGSYGAGEAPGTITDCTATFTQATQKVTVIYTGSEGTVATVGE